MIEVYNKIFQKKYLSNFFIIAILAIGSFNDSRLEFVNLNINLIISFAYFLIIIIGIVSNKPTPASKYVTLISFIVLLISIINFFIWGLNDYYGYTVDKFTTFFFITIPICYYLSTFKYIDDFKVFVLQTALVSAFLMVFGLLQLITGDIGDRLSVLGGGPIVFSRWIGYFVICLIFLVKTPNMIKILIISLCLLLMGFSGSKGPLLFLLLTLAFVQIKNTKFLLFLSFLFVIIIVFFDNFLPYLENYPAFTRLLGLDESSNYFSGTSTSARLTLFKSSLNCLEINFFGYGLGNFSNYCDPSRILGQNGYPHNIFVEIFLELGLIIFLIFGVFMLKIYFKKKYIRIDSAYQGFYSIWLFYLLNSLVSGDLSDARFLFVFSTLIYSYDFLFNKYTK